MAAAAAALLPHRSLTFKSIPKSPNLIFPKSPNFILPKSPNFILPQNPKSPNLIFSQNPKSPNLILPKSPNLVFSQNPKSPNLILPKTPNSILPQNPKTPNLIVPKSPNSISPQISTKLGFAPFPILTQSPKFSKRVVRACCNGDVVTDSRTNRGAESEKLPSSVRRRVLDAIDACGGRATVGDVAARAGLSLDEAGEALLAIVADANGLSEVVYEANTSYVFPVNYRSKIAVESSFMTQMGPLFRAGMMAIWHFLKVSVGIMLISCAVVALLVVHVIYADKNTVYKELAATLVSAFHKFSFWAIIYMCITKFLASFLKSKRLKGIVERTAAPCIEEERAPEKEDIFVRFPSLKPIIAPKRSDQEEYNVSCACWDREVKEFFSKERKWQFRDLGRAMLILLGGFNIGLVIILGTIMERVNGVKNFFKSGVHFYEELGFAPGDAPFASRFSCLVFVWIIIHM